MKFALRWAVPCLLGFLLPGCGISDGPTTLAEARQPKGTGPFDSRGNYVDDWADSPSKWQQEHAPAPVLASRPSLPEPVTQLPVVANYDEPPPHSIPISTSMRSTEPLVISNLTPRPVQPTARASSKPASSTVSKPAASKSTASKTAAKKSTAKKSTAKTVAKKPAPSRYVIKKGDSLSAIASRNKTTVAALKKANKISGTLIHPGKSLVIPR